MQFKYLPDLFILIFMVVNYGLIMGVVSYIAFGIFIRFTVSLILSFFGEGA